MAAGATVVDLPFRCTPLTADVVCDTDRRVVACVGAARSMKTQTIVVGGAREWMLHGGQGKIAWLLGPEIDRAFVLIEKYCDGEGENPPVFPPELIRHRPTSQNDKNPHIELIDGTVFAVKHMGAMGKNLTARGVFLVIATEMATATSPMNFVRLRGRIVQNKGKFLLDAVPEARNWVKQAVLDAAVTEAEEIQALRAKGLPEFAPTYRVVQLSQAVNPWVDAVESEAFMRDLMRIDPRMAAREAGGEWVDDRDLWLPMFDAAKHTFDPISRDPLEFLGLEDCTEQASFRWFSEPKAHIVGVDINARPHTALIGKIGVRKGQRPDVPANWHLVLLDVLQLYGVDSNEAAVHLANHRGGIYRGSGVIIDSTSMLARHNSGGALNQRQNILPPEAYRSAGFEVRGAMRRKHDASEYACPSKFDSSLMCRAMFSADRVHIDRRECQPFIYALRNQIAEEDGVTPEKIGNTVQDRKVAAFTDVLRNMAWPFFSLSPAATSGAPLKVEFFG